MFPEGKRFMKPYTRKLKRGSIGYAWTRKIQVQISCVFGVEHTVNEFWMSKVYDPVTLQYSLGEMIDPLDFNSEEEFY